MKTTKDKILIVDDDQAIRWSLSEALRLWSFTPIESPTASDALTQFQAKEMGNSF